MSTIHNQHFDDSESDGEDFNPDTHESDESDDDIRAPKRREPSKPQGVKNRVSDAKNASDNLDADGGEEGLEEEEAGDEKVAADEDEDDRDEEDEDDDDDDDDSVRCADAVYALLLMIPRIVLASD